MENAPATPGRPANYQPVSVPPGTPRWITPDLLGYTLWVWQPFYKKPLTTLEALDMLLNVSRLLSP